MLESAKQVLVSRIETMQEEGLLALLEETFPYVGHMCLHVLSTTKCLLHDCSAVQTMRYCCMLSAV